MIKNFVLALLAVVVVGATAFAQMDTVQLENKSIKCKILKMTPTEVVVDDRGVEDTLQVNTIKSISFNREPAQFLQARKKIEEGSNQDALDLLTEDVRGTLGDSKVLAQEMEYIIFTAKANIALGGGDVSKPTAAALGDKFITNYPKNYHFYAACELTGDVYASIGTADSLKKASALYQQLAKSPWNDMKMRSFAAMGKIFMTQKNLENAQKAYNAILGLEDKSATGDRMKLIAKMGLAKCKAMSGKYQDAIKDVEAILQNASAEDSAINALGYNTLGLAYMAGGQDKDALVAFLQVDLLYSRDVQSHIEALKNLQKLWKKLEMPTRAQECATRLKEYGVE